MQQQKQKKIPVRRCVGCNAQRPKRELVRVVRSPEGEISIDLRGKAPGCVSVPLGRMPCQSTQGKAAGTHI